ncbi:MAG: hypothetical protein ACHQ7M_17840 [Chloroflexota bacterium]
MRLEGVLDHAAQSFLQVDRGIAVGQIQPIDLQRSIRPHGDGDTAGLVDDQLARDFVAFIALPGYGSLGPLQGVAAFQLLDASGIPPGVAEVGEG